MNALCGCETCTPALFASDEYEECLALKTSLKNRKDVSSHLSYVTAAHKVNNYIEYGPLCETKGGYIVTINCNCIDIY